MNNYWVFAVGFLAQGLFSARLLLQWIKSEKAQKVIVPTIYWQLSLLASFLLICYGFLRNDIVVIGGQFISYFIYIRNLQFKNAWGYLPKPVKVLAIGIPIIFLVYLFPGNTSQFRSAISNPNIPFSLMVWGSAGQIIFSCRFVYQWIYTENLKKSTLPPGFWLISLTGSLMIITYGILRLDPVLILGNTFGAIIYSRNLYLHFKGSSQKHATKEHSV